MTRRDFIKKWLLYALGLFPIWAMDCYFLSRYPIYGVTPLLLPLAVAALATIEGELGGGGFGLWVGFLMETTYPQGTGTLIFVLTLMGFLCGKGVHRVLKRSFVGFLLSAVAILCAVEGVTVMTWLLLGKASSALLLPLAFKQIVLTLCYAPLIFWVFLKVFAKVPKK